MRLADNGWGWCAAVLMDDEHMRGRVTKGWMDGEIATRGKASTLAGTPIGAMMIVWCRSMWIVRIHGAVPRQSCRPSDVSTQAQPELRVAGRQLRSRWGLGSPHGPHCGYVPREYTGKVAWFTHVTTDAPRDEAASICLDLFRPKADMEHEPEPRARCTWETKRPVQFADACAVAGV